MNAFSSLILLIAIAIFSMMGVAYSNYLVDKKKRTTLRLERMKIRVEELEDVVLILDVICETRIIGKLVNDEIINSYELMLQISPDAGYLKAGLSNAQIRSNDLSDELAPRSIYRACKSDAQIARYIAYLHETLQILRKQHTEGKISSEEIQVFTLEIEWLELQVKVISSVVQGHKSYTKQDILGANAFYKKAQKDLLGSSHPDARRQKMISQMADILHGHRKSLDEEFMPETEFNPDNTPSDHHPATEDTAEEDLNHPTSTDEVADNPLNTVPPVTDSPTTGV
jgi:hypothetical protein